MFEIIKATEEKSVSRTTTDDLDPITPIKESNDLAETIKELNDDSLKDKFSNIDMKTRLAQIEISSIIALDSLVALNFLPIEVGDITRSKKRLAVSLNGLGRGEIVSIAQGVHDQQSNRSIMERMGGFFGVGK